MKHALFAFFIIFTSLTHAASDYYHAFTNHEGRVIRAKIIKVDGDEVRIERKDGFSFTMDISEVSEGDQAYVRNWAHEELLRNMKLDIRVTKVVDKLYTEESGIEVVETSVAFYKVKVKNKSFTDLNNIWVKYILYKKIDAGDEDTDIRRATGVVTIKHILSGGEFNFKTKNITLYNSKLVDLDVDVERSVEKSNIKSEVLAGIQMKIYMKNAVIWEFSQMPGIEDKKPWPKPVYGEMIESE